MIDPNFWSSQDVAKLSHFDRLILIGLFSNADDHGKGISAPEFIKSTLFPFDKIGICKIKRSLLKVDQNISILFYKINGGFYYKFTNWDKWQRVDKPQDSKFPEPLDSKNDSKIDNESFWNDSCLKERKGKERKLKNLKIPSQGDEPTKKQIQDQETERIISLFEKKFPNSPTKITAPLVAVLVHGGGRAKICGFLHSYDALAEAIEYIDPGTIINPIEYLFGLAKQGESAHRFLRLAEDREEKSKTLF